MRRVAPVARLRACGTGTAAVHAVRAGVLALALVGAGAAAPGTATAQAGPGTAAAAVLQIPGGSRAAGMAGAYTGATDGDAIFHNPAAAGWLDSYAGAAYQRHVVGIGYSSVGAAARLRFVGLAVTFSSLDYGSVEELVPDPAYDGQRGIETGDWVTASDVVARLTLAVPLFDRIALGGSFGLLWSTLAESVRTVEIYDLGMQYRRGRFSAGAALRHGGGQLEGASLEPADLPSEVRVGVAWAVPPDMVREVRVHTHADFVMPLYDASNAIAVGVEAGTAPVLPVPGLVGRHFAATARAGFNGAPGSGALGRMHYGAGLTMDRFALDYMLQPMGELGVAHRFGLRWQR